MGKNYKFFQNAKCEYFPCHKIKHTERFNCLFCYCPLYLVKDCGGNCKDFKGIKDCSYCLIPHIDKNYDRILEKLTSAVIKKKK